MPFKQRILAAIVAAGVCLSPALAAGAERSTLTIALDPGHGGADPGAEARGLNEAVLVLDFALRLKNLLEENDDFAVVLTRETNEAVSLDERLTRARLGGADVFLSLHADALAPEDGKATGLTVYTLDDEDVPRADRRLTERHGGDDILSRVDLTAAQGDVTRALVSLARLDTLPRSRALASSLLTTFAAGDVATNRRAHRHGGFAVLKAADMPSVLIELGFLSSAEDRARLLSDAWLHDAAFAIRDGLLLWQSEDAVYREMRNR